MLSAIAHPIAGLCRRCSAQIPEARLRKRAIFCTAKCRREQDRANWEAINPGRRSIPTASVGAISELLVGADLLRRGYEVFRALSASCSCDLAILRGGKLTRIEVRTGVAGKNGKVYFSWRQSDNGRHDVLAIVTNGVIDYRPSLDEV